MRLSDKNSGLGVTVDIPYSMVDTLAQRIVDGATPELKTLLVQERSRLTDGLWKGLPFTGGSLLAFLATYFLMPDDKVLKLTGYLVAAGLLVGGLWIFLSHMKGEEPEPEAAATAVAPAERPKSFPIEISL